MGKYSMFLMLVLLSLQSCVSTAKISNLPKKETTEDFVKIANSKIAAKTKGWRFKSMFEYYCIINTTKDSLVNQAICNALIVNKFVVKSNIDNNDFTLSNEKTGGIITGQRGLRSSEWKSVTGVYYEKIGDRYQLYINCKITQDITGDCSSMDEAQQIADQICYYLNGCEQSYPVKYYTCK
jgi:hypothetical protein